MQHEIIDTAGKPLRVAPRKTRKSGPPDNEEMQIGTELLKHGAKHEVMALRKPILVQLCILHVTKEDPEYYQALDVKSLWEELHEHVRTLAAVVNML